MKKHEAPQKRLCVEYKGGELILQPGHKVFELDLRSGIITEYKLIKKWWRFWSKRPKYRVDSSDQNKVHLPAYDIQKARVRFKQVVKALGIEVKIKDN